MSETNARLPEVLTAAYEPYVRAVLAGRSVSEPPGLDDAIEEGRRWLEEALSRMLSLPFPSQDRGPLELFQDAMRFPTKVLADAGHPAAARDALARNALPGDLYDLAPASSRDLGEGVWRAHLAWGAAKAAAMTRRTAGVAHPEPHGQVEARGGLEEIRLGGGSAQRPGPATSSGWRRGRLGAPGGVPGHRGSGGAPDQLLGLRSARRCRGIGAGAACGRRPGSGPLRGIPRPCVPGGPIPHGPRLRGTSGMFASIADLGLR